MAEESEVGTAATPINGNTPTSPNNDYTNSTQYSLKQLVKSKLYVPTMSPSSEAGNSKKKFVCPIEGCNKTYGKTSHIRSHLTWHSGEKPYVCEEPSCMRGFTRSDELARHIRTHTGEKPYECAQCTKRFTRSDHLTKHLRVHFKETKMDIAPLLEVSLHEEDCSSDANGLESNDTSSSSILPPSGLAVNVKQEIDTEQYSFAHEIQQEVGDIKIEPETIAEPSIPAFMSLDTSNTMSFAIQHLPQPIKRIKNEVKPVARPYVCAKEDCKKAFRRQDELKRHSRIHTGIKPYGCEQCNKKFLRKDHLNKHLKTHFRIAEINAAAS